MVDTASVPRQLIVDYPQRNLKRWSSEYRASFRAWFNTKITIDILGIPPHAVSKKRVSSVLAQYCHTKTCRYDPRTGICRVNALTSSRDAIPSFDKFPITEHTEKDTRSYIYCITMRTYLYSQAPSLRNNTGTSYSHHWQPSSEQQHGHRTNLHRDPIGVDSEVADEAWRDNCHSYLISLDCYSNLCGKTCCILL
ncbi:hypothetical protein BS78_10G172200 [Paspalum vaginatum]|nr:hypothetical protein BS78_10G172200 [Paspalum vaginatum]